MIDRDLRNRPLGHVADAGNRWPATTFSIGRPDHGRCGASPATKPNISTTLFDCRSVNVGFDLSQYATVEERLALFWAANPDGRIHTEPVRVDDGAALFKIGRAHV